MHQVSILHPFSSLYHFLSTCLYNERSAMMQSETKRQSRLFLSRLPIPINHRSLPGLLPINPMQQTTLCKSRAVADIQQRSLPLPRKILVPPRATRWCLAQIPIPGEALVRTSGACIPAPARRMTRMARVLRDRRAATSASSTPLVHLAARVAGSAAPILCLGDFVTP